MLVTLEFLKFLIQEMKADFQAFQMAYISFFDFNYSQSCILVSNIRKKRVFLQATVTHQKWNCFWILIYQETPLIFNYFYPLACSTVLLIIISFQEQVTLLTLKTKERWAESLRSKCELKNTDACLQCSYFLGNCTWINLIQRMEFRIYRILANIRRSYIYF